MSRHAFLLTFLLNLAVAVTSVDNYSRKDFPPGFVFGAGTSAYQVEGAANEDGRTPSVWDTFTHEGNMHGATADVSVDQYHKYKEDVQLMVETGLDAYKFSISWSRLIPNGRGSLNPKGLEYYNNLINQLISHGIQPHVTLYTFDHPQVLEDEYGGWISRKMVKDFTAYADVCFREFGDRVLHWSTINEPNMLAFGGYDLGMAPPRRCSYPFGFNCTRGNSSTEPYLAVHHMLLAHASAARLYKNKYLGKQHGFVGLTVYTFCFVPGTNSTKDVTAAKRANDFFFGWIVRPLIFGDYPDIMKKIAGSRLPSFTKMESELVKGSADFLGVIHYFAIYIKDNSNTLKSENRDFIADMAIQLSLEQYSPPPPPGYEMLITPWSLRKVMEDIKEEYGNPPIFISENGLSTRRNQTLEDTSRVEYLHGYIGSALDAIRNGSNAKGYFVWSFLDVFEVVDGYDSGYGIYYVDLDDPELKRVPKLSARWYANFLKGGFVDS